MDTITLSIDYGHDVHSVELDRRLYDAFKAGQIVSLQGQGFLYDDEGRQEDHWVLDGTTGTITVELSNCAEFIAQRHWVDDE